MEPEGMMPSSAAVCYRGGRYYTLRQLDEHLGAPKGTSFRRFRPGAQPVTGPPGACHLGGAP